MFRQGRARAKRIQTKRFSRGAQRVLQVRIDHGWRPFYKPPSSCENDLRLKRELLSSSGLDESDPEKLLDKVKERGQGQRARQELEQWTQLLIEYVDLQETAIERRRKLLSLLDQSCIFYQVNTLNTRGRDLSK